MIHRRIVYLLTTSVAIFANLSIPVSFSGFEVCLGQEDSVPIPRVLDQRLKIELFAAEPDLVTPAGIDVDDEGNVYVIESHTHFRPEGYKGPIADRIRLLRDRDGDGKAELVTTFFQGTSSTMNLAIHPNGAVYVATRNEIFRLRDRDGNGVADENTTLVKLETPGNYPHNGLSGFAFDLQGNVFFGFGENLGEPYELIGSDGARLSGGGEGGSIFRCNLDGQGLQRWATGFWNPFHLCFDDYGQLFAVDNDPDWRPPCRLLHIVEGGDYGYRFALGRRGTHPFSSWFGDVPGTLGMVCGTGEAPSGVLSYQSTALPSEYRGSLLATSWGIHAIERFRLERTGSTYASNAETIVKGGEDFRPVGIAIGPNGSLFVSDWVKRSYELHGYGRVWKISPQTMVTPPAGASSEERFASLHRPTSQRAAVELTDTEEGIAWLTRQLNPKTQGEPRLRSLALQVLVAGEHLTTEAMLQMLAEEPVLEVRLLAARIGPLSESVVALVEEQLKSEQADALAAEAVAAEMLRRDSVFDLTELAWQLCESDDPFVLQAARRAIGRSLSGAQLAQRTPPETEQARLQWALVLMSKHAELASAATETSPAEDEDVAGTTDSLETKVVEQLLSDPAPRIRFVALRWIGEAKLVNFKETLANRMPADPQIDELFESYLAAIDLLQGERSGAQYEKQEIGLLDKMVRETNYGLNRKLVDVALRRLVAAILRDREANLPSALDGDFLQNLATANRSRPGSLEAVYAIRDLPRDDAMATLEQLVNDSAFVSGRRRAVAVSGIDPESQLAKEMLQRLIESPGEQGRFTEETERELLRLQINRDLDESTRNQLQRFADQRPEYREEVQRLMAPTSFEENRPPAEAVDQWLEILNEEELAEADIVAGEDLFFHPRIARCAVCHQVKGRGGNIGPDLTHAAQLGQRRLIESILQPSREIAPKYTAWTLVTSDGKVRTGVLVTERGSDQIYADAEGASFAIHFNDIEDRTPSRKSLMPDGLLDELTSKEIRELLAFLQSLK